MCVCFSLGTVVVNLPYGDESGADCGPCEIAMGVLLCPCSCTHMLVQMCMDGHIGVCAFLVVAAALTTRMVSVYAF